jgi:hypothetical protein
MEQGAQSIDDIARMTGAAPWWITMNVNELARQGRLRTSRVPVTYPPTA